MFEDIHRSVLKLLLPLTPQETYATIVEEGCKLVGAECGSIFLANNSQLQRAFTTVPQHLFMEPRKNGYVQRAFQLQKIFIISAAQFKKERPEFKKQNLKLLVTIPLSFNKESAGVLALRSATHSYISKKKLNSIRLFGSFASLKIRNIELFSEVQKSLEARQTFISMVTHELKTPLTTITGYANLLETKLQQQQPIKTEWITSLSTETSRLARLVDNLLLANEIGVRSQLYSWQIHNFHNIILQTLQEFRKAYPHRAVDVHDLTSQQELPLYGDKDRLTHALFNILHNAAKFSQKDQPVIIEVSLAEKSYIVKIIDRGEGIAEEELQLLFTPFQKGKEQVKDGLGLGLHLSQKIIEAHHGSIHIFSAKNQGTTVEIRLPQTSL